MIEALMFFALGFLSAALIALLIIPAINARAERLARRRLEALFPLSIDELLAEKDHLRAEFAVQQRQLERKLEEALGAKQRDMAELGRRTVQVETLEAEVATRAAGASELERALEDVRVRLAAAGEEAAAANQALAAERETMAALDDAHRRTLDELAATRGKLETASAALAEARTALSAAEGRHAELEGQHAASLSELDTKRITISDLETRLATHAVRGEMRAPGAGEHHADAAEVARLGRELTDLRAERDALLARLDERKSALEALQDKLAQAEGRAAETAAAARQVEELLAERAALERAVAAAREEQARREQDGRNLNPQGGQAGESLRAENAELRRRIDEVAAEIMRVAATTNGSGARPGKLAAGGRGRSGRSSRS